MREIGAGSCRARGVEPSAYLLHGLTELPQRAANADISDLLPLNFDKSHGASASVCSLGGVGYFALTHQHNLQRIVQLLEHLAQARRLELNLKWGHACVITDDLISTQPFSPCPGAMARIRSAMARPDFAAQPTVDLLTHRDSRFSCGATELWRLARVACQKSGITAAIRKK